MTRKVVRIEDGKVSREDFSDEEEVVEFYAGGGGEREREGSWGCE